MNKFPVERLVTATAFGGVTVFLILMGFAKDVTEVAPASGITVPVQPMAWAWQEIKNNPLRFVTMAISSGLITTYMF